MRLTKEKINFVADQLTNNENASDAELIFHIASQIGSPICHTAKLVKTERKLFSWGVVREPAKVIRKYLRKK